MKREQKGLRLTTGASTQQGVLAERKLAFAVLRQAFEDAALRPTRSKEVPRYGFKTSRELARAFLIGNKPDDECVREFWATLAGCTGAQLKRAALRRLGEEEAN